MYESVFQLHHQNKKDRSNTIFCAQKVIQNQQEMKEWNKDVTQRFPLPKGFEWLCCNLKSRYALKQAGEATKEEYLGGLNIESAEV